MSQTPTNRFSRIIEVTTIRREPFTSDEIGDLLTEASPTRLYNSQYSPTKPCAYITQPVKKGDTGVYLYYDSWPNQTPKFYTWKSLHWSLSISGLDNWAF